MLVLATLTLRPQVDLRRGDFPFFLQAKSFAEFRLDVEVPPGAELLSVDMALHDGRYYSHYPPGTSLLLAPFYWAGVGLDRLTGGILGEQRSGGWRVGTLTFIVVHLANVVFLAGIFFCLRRLAALFGMASSGFVRSIALLFFAAPFWNLSSHLTSHLPSTLLVLAATVLTFEARRRGSKILWSAGLAGGASLLVRPTNALLLLLLASYVAVTFRKSLLSAGIALGFPMLAGGLLLLWLNRAMFGGALVTGYEHEITFGKVGEERAVSVVRNRFAMPLGEGLFGLTLGAVSSASPPSGRPRSAVLPRPELPWDRVRGLLLLMPVIAFAIPGFLRLSHSGMRAETAVLAAEMLLLLLLYAKWSWWFGNAHTPLPCRFLAEAFPGWCLAIAAYSPGARKGSRLLLRFTAAWAILNQMLVVLGVYVHALTGVEPITMTTGKVAAILALGSALIAALGQAG